MHTVCDLNMLLCIMQHDMLICILIIYMTNIVVGEVSQLSGEENCVIGFLHICFGAREIPVLWNVKISDTEISVCWKYLGLYFNV